MPEPPAYFQDAMERLAYLETLPADWDAEGASAPSPRAIATGHDFLIRAAWSLGGLVSEHPERLRPFAVVPLADGGVQIEWRTPEGNDLEVQIGPDGTFGYLLIEQRDEGRVFREDEGVSSDVVLRLLALTLAPTLGGRARATAW